LVWLLYIAIALGDFLLLLDEGSRIGAIIAKLTMAVGFHVAPS